MNLIHKVVVLRHGSVIRVIGTRAELADIVYYVEYNREEYGKEKRVKTNPPPQSEERF